MISALNNIQARGELSLFSLWLLLSSFITSCRVQGYQAFDFANKPSQIRIKAGILQAPPFAFIDEDLNNPQNLTFRGFHVDLIEQMKIFAAENDGIELLVDLDRGPPHYATAVDALANDCNTTVNPKPLEDCQAYDLILGDFYSTAERYMRVDFTPPWLRTSVSTLKHIDKVDGIEDLTTLKEAEAASAPVCVPKLTFLGQAVMEHIPGTITIECDGSSDECIQAVKNGTCALFADDALLLHYRASQDPTIAVTREQFRSQYLVWPLKQSLDPWASMYIKKWIYEAGNNGTLDELYHKYFQKELCPIGTAGDNCELPCDPDHGAADSSGVCRCRSTKWTGDDCSIEVLEETHMLSSNLLAVCYSLVGITFVIVTCCAVWVIRNRNRAQVKMAQPSFLLLVLIGCIISTSTILALAQEDEGDGPVEACMAIPWLYSVGFSITFGTLFAKIRRIYKLMESAAEMKRLTVSTTDTAKTVGWVLLIDVTILLVWTIVDPLQWKRVTTSADQFGEPLESQGYCTSDHWVIFTSVIASFHLLLMGVACYMCYLARSIPERFSNGKFLSIAMFSNLQILIVAIPVLIILGSDPVSSFFIRMVVIWINDFVVICLIFGNLIYQVYKFDRNNRLARISSQLSIHTDIHNYAKKTRSKDDLMDEISSSRHGDHSRNIVDLTDWLTEIKKNSGQHALDSDLDLESCHNHDADLRALEEGKQSDVISVLSDSVSVSSDFARTGNEHDLENQNIDQAGQPNVSETEIATPHMMTDMEEDDAASLSERPIDIKRNNSDAELVFPSSNSDVRDHTSKTTKPIAKEDDDNTEEGQSLTQSTEELQCSDLQQPLQGLLGPVGSTLNYEAAELGAIIKVSEQGSENSYIQPRIPVDGPVSITDGGANKESAILRVSKKGAEDNDIQSKMPFREAASIPSNEGDKNHTAGRVSKEGSDDYETQPSIPIHESPLPSVTQ